MDNSECSNFAAVNDIYPYRFYVYAWQYPDGRTFYVGKGAGARDTEPKRNRYFKHIVAKIRREGGEPIIVRWHDGLLEEDALKLEVAYIKLFGRRDKRTGVLCNMTDGGDGVSGLSHSDEARAKISDSLRGNTRTLGLIHGADARAKMSAAGLGRAKSAEHRAKIGDAHRGKEVGEVTRAKLRAFNLGKKYSDESRARMSAARRGKSLSSYHAMRISEALTGRVFDDEHRERISKAKRMASPKEGFKGVRWHKSRWVAQIVVDRKQQHIGSFPSAEEAARAYDEAVDRFWGPGPWYRNFSDSSSLSA